MRKQILGLLLSMCMILGMCMTTYASENEPTLGDVVDGSILTNESSSESILYNPARGNILNRGVARISEIGSGQINVYGAVMAAVQCDTPVSYTSLLTKSYNYTVTKGYYYRVMAGCIATKAGTTETQIPITNGIWVD